MARKLAVLKFACLGPRGGHATDAEEQTQSHRVGPNRDSRFFTIPAGVPKVTPGGCYISH